ncbi:MAG: hypothetical protein UY27_C0015G0011 [Candidatus Gottesmanbacteria bacterium GW2011_GWA1_48_13]|uniref:GGDEF domain-containing protein n=1 Tax=Candidatus Gottesmanbacteria bacterium GW2011_GWA1_48_13 TaxID=1618439 RepID=A0A0G1XMF2_9BACT|nr:MAG: hypothetical protein UY27_C0015G0011 [Candidatus Gottesmanbacteria bacterium GW2011_GWA1_48_13]
MVDTRGESIRDKHVAWEAAHLTKKIIDTLEINASEVKGPTSQQAFAVAVGDVMVDQAERIVQGEKDAVTGLSLNSVVRRNIAEHLKSGGKGVVLGLDMVGLKHLNTFSHAAGDKALTIVAEVMGEFGFTDLGRQGDEFYAFMPGVDEVEMERKFREHMKRMERDGRLVEPTTGLDILNYWVCGNINRLGDLDKVISKLDEDVEGIKERVGRELMRLINQASFAERTPLMMLYFNLKRRAQGEEIANFANSVGQDLLSAYGITSNQFQTIDGDVLKKIPEDLKVKFHGMQARILDDTHIGNVIRQ